MSPWATNARYPDLDTDGGPTVQDIQQAIAEIATLAALVDGMADLSDD